MKRAADIVSLFQREAMKIGKKKKAENMSNVAEEQTREVVCMPVVIEEQTEEPILSMSNVTTEQTEDVSSPYRQELEKRFDEINMELLSCMSALNPTNSFAAFDAQKVCKLASKICIAFKIGIESLKLICFF